MLILVIFASSIFATAQSELKIGEDALYIVTEEWAGFSNADGTGLYFEVMRRVFEPEGIQLVYKIQPILRSIASINSGNKADVMLADWNRQYLLAPGQYQVDKLIHPQFPIYAEYLEAISHADRPLSWAQIVKNKNTRVAWIRGYGYDDQLGLKEHAVTRLNNAEQGLKMLTNGHIDAFFSDVSEFLPLLKQEGFSRLKWHREFVTMRKLYPIFHNNERGQRFAAIYDQRMAQMLKSGALYELYQGFGEDYQQVLADEVDPAY